MPPAQHLKQLYLTGYILSYSGWYFNHVVIAEQLAAHHHPDVQEECEKMITWVKGQSEWFMQNIPHVNRVAGACGLTPLPAPTLPADYFKWTEQNYQGFYQLFPVASAEQLIFNLGFNLGNISCSIELLKTFVYLNLKLSAHLHYHEQLAYLVADINTITERLNLITTLLGALPDTEFAQDIWLQLKNEVQQILSFNPQQPNAQQHLLLYEYLLQTLPAFHQAWTDMLNRF
ncbi:MAG TPA: hypothetical protein PK239_09300 [Chitinophagales bacterium]|nr:hypothetical protein [Chitinophagales bacterium]HRK27472.1 hypothetical protein [Chitinophagales bacterium]